MSAGLELLDDLSARAAQIAQRAGLSKEQALELGAALALEVSSAWGGSSVYIPRAVELRERHRAIYEAFNGRNYLALARQFKLSERMVRIIVARGRMADLQARQSTLFDR